MFKNNINCIIFDLDDTLYPQTEYTRQCLYNSLPIFEKYYEIPKQLVKHTMDYVLDKNGIDYKHTYDDIFTMLQIDGKTHIEEMLALFRNAKPNLNLFNNSKDVLDILRNKSYILGMITDGPVNVQQYKIENLKIKEYFDYIVYTDSLGIEKRKPSTAGFKKFLEYSKLDGNNCIYVGNDPRKDFKPAKELGMYTIRIIQGEYKNLTMDTSYEADINIWDIIELIKIIGG